MRWTPHALVEGCAIGGVRDRRGDGLHLHPRRVHRAAASAWRPRSRKRTPPASSARTRWARASASTSYVHSGAGAYICGEETALMNSLEGQARQPAHQAAVPGGRRACSAADDDQQRRDAGRGAAHPHRTARSGTRRCRSSSPKSTGTQAVLGVRKHCSARATTKSTLGFPFKDFLYDLCGGPRPGRTLQGDHPRRRRRCRSRRWKRPRRRSWTTRASSRKGTMLGSGGVIVFDDAQCMVKQIARLARFFAHESCAQCTQCREGTAWTTRILERIVAGQGTTQDLDTLLELSDNMTGKTICVLSDSCAAPVVSGIQKFRHEFEALHQRQAQCPLMRGGGLMAERGAMVNLTIEGRAGPGPGRHVDPRGREARRRAHPALLLPPGAAGRRRVPHVPGGSGEGAEARAGLRDGGGRRAGGARPLAPRRSKRARACSSSC